MTQTAMKANTMMILGQFPFWLHTAPYQTVDRKNSWRYVKNDRVGKSPSYQYVGPDEEPITLSGTLYPEISVGDFSLKVLESMAFSGMPWPLIEGTGRAYGMYIIESLSQNRTEFLSNGQALKIDFTLTLKRVGDSIDEYLTENVRHNGAIRPELNEKLTSSQ
ncbi:phage tail protein [Serratia microhaemolytica]|uniref:phage tail protein n=1 Tax=Serratia microhaemolytica TaxID=2675110 RepID=UPI001F0C5C18|nr:phage tail protein [Serratia microhaemolytica]